MKGFVKLMIGLGFGTLLSGCVIAPAPGRAYIGVAAPAVVVQPYYYRGYRWYGYRRW